jgi:hypothetical protein
MKLLCAYRGQILGRNCDKSRNSGWKLCSNVHIVYRNLKSENSQDYAQKPQRNCTFMNSASGQPFQYFFV